MARYMELAEQLGEAIVETEEYQRFITLEQELHQDEVAQKLIEIFSKAQQEVMESHMQGNRIPKNVIDDLKEHQRRMLEYPSVAKYMEAKEKLDRIMEAVNEVLSSTTGLNTGGGGGGCGSSGGGGCSGGCC